MNYICLKACLSCTAKIVLLQIPKKESNNTHPHTSTEDGMLDIEDAINILDLN